MKASFESRDIHWDDEMCHFLLLLLRVWRHIIGRSPSPSSSLCVCDFPLSFFFGSSSSRIAMDARGYARARAIGHSIWYWCVTHHCITPIGFSIRLSKLQQALHYRIMAQNGYFISAEYQLKSNMVVCTLGRHFQWVFVLFVFLF